MSNTLRHILHFPRILLHLCWLFRLLHLADCLCLPLFILMFKAPSPHVDKLFCNTMFYRSYLIFPNVSSLLFIYWYLTTSFPPLLQVVIFSLTIMPQFTQMAHLVFECKSGIFKSSSLSGGIEWLTISKVDLLWLKRKHFPKCATQHYEICASHQVKETCLRSLCLLSCLLKRRALILTKHNRKTN